MWFGDPWLLLISFELEFFRYSCVNVCLLFIEVYLLHEDLVNICMLFYYLFWTFYYLLFYYFFIISAKFQSLFLTLCHCVVVVVAVLLAVG